MWLAKTLLTATRYIGLRTELCVIISRALWYSTVVFACAIGNNFEQLQVGDQDSVGSKGIVLSEGQRQRLVNSLKLLRCLNSNPS